MLTSLALLAAATLARPELELTELRTGRAPLELSGIATIDGRTVVVSDGAKEHFLYELKADRRRKGDRRFETPAWVDLSKLAGFAEYAPAGHRLDLEGLAVCGKVVYAADERARQVMVIDLDAKTIKRAPVDFAAVPRMADGEANAGFEGIAADCAGRTLYVAKERDPRFIVKVDLDSWAVTGTFDVGLSDRAGQMVVNPWNGEGLFAIGPDFADLAFDGGFLYALERNTYEIAKIDPKTQAVVARVSYFKTEKGLYETGEPFGIAEALLVTPDAVVVGFDNNNTPLTAAGAERTGVKGNVPVVATFRRPAGF